MQLNKQKVAARVCKRLNIEDLILNAICDEIDFGEVDIGIEANYHDVVHDIYRMVVETVLADLMKAEAE